MTNRSKMCYNKITRLRERRTLAVDSDHRLPKKTLEIAKNLLTNHSKHGIINIESEVRTIEEKKIPRRQSKQDLENALLKKLDEWIKSGDTPEQALEKLSMRQYDFLIERDVNLDNLILTTEQQAAIRAITKAPRTCKPGGYDKKYPQAKRELYQNMVEFITAQGAEVVPRDKQNYRDLDFTLNGTAYKIVLSNPRTKKL